MATTKITLILDSADASGTLFARGSARVFPSQRIPDTTDQLLIEIAPVTARFKGRTPPQIDLYPCDLIGPQGDDLPAWNYTVYYDSCPGGPQPWSFRLLSTDGATQRLSSLTALTP